MGLMLAIPLLGATKIICDYIDSLRGLGSVVRQLKFQGNLSIKAFKGFGARLEAAVLGRCEVVAKKEPLPVDLAAIFFKTHYSFNIDHASRRIRTRDSRTLISCNRRIWRSD